MRSGNTIFRPFIDGSNLVQEANRAQKFEGDDSEAQRLKKSENGRTWFDLVQPGSCQSWCKITRCHQVPMLPPNAVDPYHFDSFYSFCICSFFAAPCCTYWVEEIVDSIWDVGLKFPPWKLWTSDRCFAQFALQFTPQERLMKFYGSVRAERVSAEASESNSFLRIFLESFLWSFWSLPFTCFTWLQFATNGNWK